MYIIPCCHSKKTNWGLGLFMTDRIIWFGRFEKPKILRVFDMEFLTSRSLRERFVFSGISRLLLLLITVQRTNTIILRGLWLFEILLYLCIYNHWKLWKPCLMLIMLMKLLITNWGVRISEATNMAHGGKCISAVSHLMFDIITIFE